MHNELKTKDDAWIQSIHSNIDRLSVRIDNITNNAAPILNGEDYLCDKEVSQLLKVSRRTLNDYRSNGTLPYYVLGGKVLYKRSEIDEVLRQGYRDTSRMKGGGNA